MKIKATNLVKGTLYLAAGKYQIVQDQVIDLPDTYANETSVLYAFTEGWLEKVGTEVPISVLEPFQKIPDEEYVSGSELPPRRLAKKVVKQTETPVGDKESLPKPSESV